MNKPPVDSIDLAGFSILSATHKEALQLLGNRITNKMQTVLFFANTNFIVKCQSFKQKMTGAGTIIINDGVGLDIAAKLVTNKCFADNLCGTDFLPELLTYPKQGLKVYLLGAAPNVAKKAAAKLTSEYGVTVVGYRDGFQESKDPRVVVDEINRSNADVLLVAMGNPQQEAWILNHRDELSTLLMIGVGAFFDFLAGNATRAPVIMRKCRLEWLYRLSREPNRLMRRYTVDIFVFLKLCLAKSKRTPTPTNS